MTDFTNVILEIDDSDATLYADEGMKMSTSHSIDESEGDCINGSDGCYGVVPQMITLFRGGNCDMTS